MPRAASETRRRILEHAYRLFYREGFQRAGVEAAGVTKRALYNHYPSKDNLSAGVLEAQAELAAAEIRHWCGEGFVTPEELVCRIFAGLRRWARTPGWRGSGFTRAAMELAWAPGHPGTRAPGSPCRCRTEASGRADVGRSTDHGRCHQPRLPGQITPDEPRTRRLLVRAIGINDYSEAPDLRSAENDAQAVGQGAMAQANGRLYGEVVPTVLLGPDATRANIITAVRQSRNTHKL